MSEPSPYRELGVQADVRSFAARGLRKPNKNRERDLYSGAPAAARGNHYWENVYSRADVVSNTQRCRKCGRPKFAVDGLRCAGRKGVRR